MSNRPPHPRTISNSSLTPPGSVYSTPPSYDSPGLAPPTTFKRSPSVTAVVDYFETRSRPTAQDPSRLSPEKGRAQGRSSPARSAGGPSRSPARIPPTDAGPSGLPRPSPRPIASYRSTSSTSQDAPSMPVPTQRPSTSASRVSRSRRLSGQRLGSIPQGPRRPSTASNASARSGRLSVDSRGSFSSIQSDRRTDLTPSFRNLTVSPEAEGEFGRSPGSSSPTSRLRHPGASLTASGIPKHAATRTPPGSYPSSSSYTLPRSRSTPSGLGDPSPTKTASSGLPLSSKRKPPVSVSVSRPTPDKISPSKARRAQSFPQADATTPTTPTARSFVGDPEKPGSRRTSFHLSSTSGSSRRSSQLTSEFADEMGGLPEALEAYNRQHSSPQKTLSAVSDLQQSPNRRTSIEIPPRRSSIDQGSPIMTRQSTGPPISPRKSSMMVDQPLPDTYMALLRDDENNDDAVTPHGRSSPPTKLATMSDVDDAPIPPPMTSDRRALGLSINPVLAQRHSSGPTPPVPAKSPLRSMSNQSTPAPTSLDSPALYLDSPQLPEPPPSATTSTTSLDKSFISESSTSAGKRASGRRRGSRFFEMDEVTDVRGGPNQLEAPSSDIRFTSVTFPSVYSQDSAPNSAWLSPDSGPPTAWSMESGPPSSTLWGQHDLSPLRTSIERSHAERAHRREAAREKPRVKGLDDLWGRKRGSKQDHDIGPEALSELQGLPALPRLTMPDESGVEIVDSPATATTMSAGTLRSMSSNTASTGHAGFAVIPRPAQEPQTSAKPVRSPSAPILGGPIRSAQVASLVSSAAVSRDQLGIAPDQLLPSAISRSPTAPTLSPGLSTPSGSKRTHLIREIAMTERAYAKDLALVRDAYLSREMGTATPQLGDSPAPPRSPIRSRQVSGHNPTGSDDTPGVSRPRTPSGAESLNVPGYFAPYHSPGAASTSVHSLSPSAFTSNRSSIISVSGNSTATSKPLSTADIRTIFCNIDHLAAGAEEMATALELAMGNEDSGPGSQAREGEGGTDKIGEAFISVLPRLRPLYLFYCARQAAASDRLIEIQADHGHHAFLKECWEQIKSHTHAWNLDSMLIKPVQRITKYPLLFDDLLACTTPVHPDYFNIRSAAEMARSLAVEIDEEKRRKDIVAYAIAPKKSLSTTSPSKENSKPKGLKLFRREKSNPSSVPMSSATSSSVELDTVPDVSEASSALMKTLSTRLEEYELSVRKIGKEIVFWTASVKEVSFAEDQLVTSWVRLICLEDTGPPADRMDAFRAALKDALTGPWAALNSEIKSQVMPSLAKLLQAAVNPRKVITRRDLKLLEYGRYVALRDAKKPMDRALVQSARDFVALHTQLVHELPTFLDGYARILDIAIIAFSECQARYHARVKEILEAFKSRWFVLPRKKSPQLDLSSPNGEVTGGGREIVKLWHQAWAPYGQALDHFHFTQPSRTLPPRLQSYTAPSETSLGLVPSLSHSSSFHVSASSSRPESPSKNSTRARASSLRQKVQAQFPAQPQDKATSPSEWRFSLLRNSNRPSKADLAARANRPSSVTLSGSERSRYSFGLPKITSEATGRMFEGLGLSPTKPSTANGRGGMRATSDPHTYADVTAPRRRSAAGLGLGITGERGERVTPERLSNGYTSIAEAKEGSTTNGTRSTREKVDAADGWRNEPALYQCACVADFDIRVWGNKKYRGLRFLSMRSGDLFDIFHEVGRIDELPSFPYPQVGVENDGVLVGRAEDGAIGLLICSFLEPLRET